MALGSYDVTPVELAGAYSIFANEGMYVEPALVSSVRTRSGEVVFERRPQPRPVLNPGVAYLMDTMLEEVLRTGTGARVRSR